MKRFAIPLIFLILLAGCAVPLQDNPATQTSESSPVINEATPTLTPTPASTFTPARSDTETTTVASYIPPAPTSTPVPETTPKEVRVEQPLSYEVVDKFVKEDKLVTTSSIQIGGKGSKKTSSEPLYIARATIKNTDKVDGKFTVRFVVNEPLIKELLTQSVTIAAGESHTFECPALTLGDWNITVTPETKSVIKIQ